MKNSIKILLLVIVLYRTFSSRVNFEDKKWIQS